jgi:hypothetical protein
MPAGESYRRTVMLRSLFRLEAEEPASHVKVEPSGTFTVTSTKTGTTPNVIGVRDTDQPSERMVKMFASLPRLDGTGNIKVYWFVQ